MKIAKHWPFVKLGCALECGDTGAEVGTGIADGRISFNRRKATRSSLESVLNHCSVRPYKRERKHSRLLQR